MSFKKGSQSLSDSSSDLEDIIGPDKKWNPRSSELISTSAFESGSGSGSESTLDGSRKMSPDELKSFHEPRISMNQNESSVYYRKERSQSGDDDDVARKNRVISPTPAKRGRSQNVVQHSSRYAYGPDNRELRNEITSANTSGRAIQARNKRPKRKPTARMTPGGRYRGDKTDMSSSRTGAVLARRPPPTTAVRQQRWDTRNGVRVNSTNLRRTRSGTAFVERGHSTRVNSVQSQNSTRQWSLISDRIDSIHSHKGNHEMCEGEKKIVKQFQRNCRMKYVINDTASNNKVGGKKVPRDQTWYVVQNLRCKNCERTVGMTNKKIRISRGQGKLKLDHSGEHTPECSNSNEVEIFSMRGIDEFDEDN